MELLENAPLQKYTCQCCEYYTNIKALLEKHNTTLRHGRLIQGLPAKRKFKCSYPDCGHETWDSSNFGRHAQTHLKKRVRGIKKLIKIIAEMLQKIEQKCAKNDECTSNNLDFLKLERHLDLLKENLEYTMNKDWKEDQQEWNEVRLQ